MICWITNVLSSDHGRIFLTKPGYASELIMIRSGYCIAEDFSVSNSGSNCLHRRDLGKLRCVSMRVFIFGSNCACSGASRLRKNENLISSVVYP